MPAGDFPFAEYSSRRVRTILFVILLVAFAIRIVAALREPNIYYPDEIFQTQEPAHRMAFGPGVVSWEWRDGIRSYVFPFALSLVMRCTAFLGTGSTGYLGAITVLMCLLSLLPVWFCFRWAERSAGPVAGLIAGITASVSYLMVFFAPKTLTEVVATSFLLPGVLIGAQARETGCRRRLFAAGALLGLAVALRLQFAPTVLVAALWICWSGLRSRLPPMVFGLVVPLLLFGFADAFTLGYPFASFVRYFWVNVVEGKSQHYGKEPWFFLIQKLWLYYWPFLIPAVFALRRSPLLWGLLLTLVGSHSVLAHKEFRFVYAAVPLTITLFGIGCASLIRTMEKYTRPWVGRTAVVATVLAALLISFYQKHRWTHWRDHAGQILTANSLSKDPGVCGVAYWGTHWSSTAGYTHLHRDVPILIPPTEDELHRSANQFNVLISEGSAGSKPEQYVLSNCSFEVCTYRRPGPCAPAGANEVNTYLRNTKQ